MFLRSKTCALLPVYPGPDITTGSTAATNVLNAKPGIEKTFIRFWKPSNSAVTTKVYVEYTCDSFIWVYE